MPDPATGQRTEPRPPIDGPWADSRIAGWNTDRVGTTRQGSEAIHATSRARLPTAIPGGRANPLQLPGTGVEPARPHGHMALNHARLPIPPPGHQLAGRLDLAAGDPIEPARQPQPIRQFPTFLRASSILPTSPLGKQTGPAGAIPAHAASRSWRKRRNHTFLGSMRHLQTADTVSEPAIAPGWWPP